MKTLIVLTDFSKAATNAAKYAAALTHQFTVSKFILFNSYEFRPVATDIPMTNQAGMAAQREESIRKLEELKLELLPFIAAETQVETMATENALIYAVHSLIEKFHAELMVMGITGMSGFERAIIGSNTITVAREITSPLLLVPHMATFKTINKVVFATDLKNNLRKSANEIKSIIKALGARLLILNVEKSGKEHFNPAMVSEQAMLHEVWDENDPEYHFNENDDIAAGILDFIKTHEVQMLIAIPKQHRFFESIFHKSITKRLTYHTPIPLLLLQPG